MDAGPPLGNSPAPRDPENRAHMELLLLPILYRQPHQPWVARSLPRWHPDDLSYRGLSSSLSQTWSTALQYLDGTTKLQPSSLPHEALSAMAHNAQPRPAGILPARRWRVYSQPSPLATPERHAMGPCYWPEQSVQPEAPEWEAVDHTARTDRAHSRSHWSATPLPPAPSENAATDIQPHCHPEGSNRQSSRWT